MDLDALEARYREAIEGLPPTKGNLRGYLLLRTLESRRERVIRTRSSLAVERFNLVFIGKVGTGKTTAICNLFDLTGDFERGKPPRTRTEPLLTTGNGRSTICEVEIARNSETAIEVEPLSPEEMRELLVDFKDSVFARVHPERYEKPTDGLGAEVDRAIRNIVALNKTERDGKEVDPAIDRASEGDGSSFLDALVTAANLESRIETRVTFPGGDERAELAWLQGTFKEINVGRRAGFAIPKRIRVLLGPSFTDDGEPAFVGHVVDTKGLDELLVRTDIDRYIDRDDALCLFTSGFAGAPDGEVLNYVERHLLDRTSGFERRCILLVLPRNGEAAQVLGSDGNAVENEQTGEIVKAGHARLAFQNRGLNFLSDNIVFYDARRGYSQDRLTEEELAADGRRAFFQQVARIVAARRDHLVETATALEEELAKLLGGSSALGADDSRIVAEALALLRQSAVDVPADDFVYQLMNYLRQKRRAIQLHALNRRFGVHGETSLFEIARARGHDLARTGTQQEFNRVTGCLSDIRDRASSDLALFLAELEEQLQVRYEAYLKTVGSKVRGLVEGLLDPLDLSNKFWRAAIEEWGKGPGYWDRVAIDYEQGLEGVATKVRETAREAWKTDVTEPLARFLAEE